MKLTKKHLKETSDYHCYTSSTAKYHCFYYDWKPGVYGKKSGGYKYALAANSVDFTKAELFNLLHEWLTGDKADCVTLPYYVYSREAETDDNRFKVGISLNLDLFK